jgi:hypothetical protein
VTIASGVALPCQGAPFGQPKQSGAAGNSFPPLRSGRSAVRQLGNECLRLAHRTLPSRPRPSEAFAKPGLKLGSALRDGRTSDCHWQSFNMFGMAIEIVYQ